MLFAYNLHELHRVLCDVRWQLQAADNAEVFRGIAEILAEEQRLPIAHVRKLTFVNELRRRKGIDISDRVGNVFDERNDLWSKALAGDDCFHALTVIFSIMQEFAQQDNLDAVFRLADDTHEFPLDIIRNGMHLPPKIWQYVQKLEETKQSKKQKKLFLK